MSWKVASENGGFQVRKLHEDGSLGEAVGPLYDVERKAVAYLRDKNTADATEENMLLSENKMTSAIHFEADEMNPRLLHFKDYILARPETNKNKDAVDKAGIEELAKTIAGMPLDANHDPTKNVGFFTAGRVGSEGELRVDGAIWLDRCEENGIDAQEVIDGLFGMSIEADATIAECSKCRQTFTNESQYCEHIRVMGNDQGIRSKIKHGAERIMRGLRALGGAFTKKPAGSGTGLDSLSGMTFCASHIEMAENQIESVDKREDVSQSDKERAKKEYGDVKFADEKNKKYALGTEEEIRAAWSYIHMPKNRKFYSEDDLSSMERKIISAWKDKIDKDGPPADKKNEEKASMDDKEKEEALEEEKKEAEEKKEVENKTEATDMKAEYEDMKAKLADMTAKLEAANQEKANVESKLQAAETQLVEANNKIVAHEATLKAFKVSELKSKLVGSVMDEDEFNAKQETLLGLPADAIELMTRNKKEVKPSDGRLNMAAGEQQDTIVWKLHRS